jgi:hypothetical protein
MKAASKKTARPVSRHLATAATLAFCELAACTYGYLGAVTIDRPELAPIGALSLAVAALLCVMPALHVVSR